MSSPMQNTAGSRSISSQIPWRIASKYVSCGMTDRVYYVRQPEIVAPASSRLARWRGRTIILTSPRRNRAALDQLAVKRTGGLGRGAVVPIAIRGARNHGSSHCGLGHWAHQRNPGGLSQDHHPAAHGVDLRDLLAGD